MICIPEQNTKGRVQSKKKKIVWKFPNLCGGEGGQTEVWKFQKKILLCILP